MQFYFALWIIVILRYDCFLFSNGPLLSFPIPVEKYFALIFFRENDLLKHQLKRYVNAVQMLRAEGSQDDNSKLLYLLQ